MSGESSSVRGYSQLVSRRGRDHTDIVCPLDVFLILEEMLPLGFVTFIYIFCHGSSFDAADLVQR
jgi:hypothetical protein